MNENEPLQNYITELRRGSLTMAVLGCLGKPSYGYALLQQMQQMNVDIEANTLYPLLRRLESQGLLSSDWDTTESRPRKYYTINNAGRSVLSGLLGEWEKMRISMERICGEEQEYGDVD